MSAKRASPMPRTCLRSSTDLKPPSFSRSRTIASASVGPMPGNVSRSLADAVLRSSGPAGAPLLPLARRPTGRWRPRWARVAETRHRDAFPVGDRCGEVQPFEVGVIGGATGGRNCVAHTRAGGQFDDARRAHRAHDVHHRAGLRGGRRRDRGRRRGDVARCGRRRARGRRTDPHRDGCEQHDRDHRGRDARVRTPLLHPFGQRHAYFGRRRAGDRIGIRKTGSGMATSGNRGERWDRRGKRPGKCREVAAG